VGWANCYISSGKMLILLIRHQRQNAITHPAPGVGSKSEEYQVDIVNLNKGGTSADYTRERLKRDRPDLLYPC
jgi:hypothetical protein